MDIGTPLHLPVVGTDSTLRLGDVNHEWPLRALKDTYTCTPGHPPSMNRRPNFFLSRILREHRLAIIQYQSPSSQLRTKLKPNTYEKLFRNNFLANPSSISGLHEELHITLCQVGSVVSVEYQDRRGRRGWRRWWWVIVRQCQIACFEKRIMLSLL